MQNRRRSMRFLELVPQPDERSCSVASVAMLINAVRARRRLPYGEGPVTPGLLLESVGNRSWKTAVGPRGRGVGLETLAGLIGQSLNAFGIDGFEIELHYVDRAARAARLKVREVLASAFESAHHYVLANFLQSVYTGNPAAAVGHFAPVASYDPRRRRVFILDPDHRWYEPYWVSEDRFLQGMATRDDATGKSRGYLSVRIDAASRATARP